MLLKSFHNVFKKKEKAEGKPYVTADKALNPAAVLLFMSSAMLSTLLAQGKQKEGTEKEEGDKLIL